MKTTWDISYTSILYKRVVSCKIKLLLSGQLQTSKIPCQLHIYIYILSLQSICLMLYYILPSLWQSIMPGKISRLSQLRSSSHVHDISQWHTAPLIHFPRKKPRHGRLTESFPSRHRRRHLVAVQLLDQPAVDFLSRYNTIKQDVIQSLAAGFFLDFATIRSISIIYIEIYPMKY